MIKKRHLIFLKDVLLMACTGFGGPQAHLSMYFNVLVTKRGYLDEKELVNLYSFCQILPGPASTQTITAIGFRLGGPKLAFLTLLVWILPATIMMTLAGILMSFFHFQNINLSFTKFIAPIAIGFVVYSAYKISSMVLKNKLSIFLCLLSIFLSYFIKSPAIFPIALLLCGAIAGLEYKKEENIAPSSPIKIEWANLILFLIIALGSGLLGYITMGLPKALPINLGIRLFENFYRNGSLVFGGGQSLIAVLHKQFVEFKGYLSPEEFLSGYALLQILPGPLFSFSSYIGALAMREYGISGQIIGGVIGAIGIFLPGTILIFFVIRFWGKVKNNAVMKAALLGINAGSAGILISTIFILSSSIEINLVSLGLVLATFLLLNFTKTPPALIIITGFLGGIYL
ncbi:MAG: chromate efflux transporter [Cytophagales bacterium]|nr:MAG: chromate efflux transporter [Cytophagales bacterium]